MRGITPAAHPACNGLVMQSRLDRIDDWERRARECGYNASKMAERAGVTLRLLELFFHDRFGMGPHDWMLEVRMADAFKLVVAKVSVKDVASKVGYKQVSHFSREFKRYYGFPPRQYVFGGSIDKNGNGHGCISDLDNNFGNR